ncbi:macro domain-containing protein [Halomonas faecis]|uniref:macro domain-containing protein n=1 Tax=Halomonas faecis TaxID=1562110 RepID=UPI0013D10147|nr:macro domain-containing protein [Halomonas faecis]
MNIFADLKTWRFWKSFLVSAFACGGFISAIFQFVIIVFPSQATSLQGLGVIIGTVIISIIFGLIVSWPRPIEMEYSAPKTIIKIIKGDLLEQDGHLVVGVCDTFDTELPNIISPRSLLGQTINHIFGGDVKSLDEQLNQTLSKLGPEGQIDKEGKTEKYGIGTVAPVQHSPRIIYFLSYCEMNQRNEAFGTVDGVWKSLVSLWDKQSELGNHGPISVPVIGGGQARMSHLLPAQDSIRLIALSFMFASRQHKISDELRIVVQSSDYDRLDRLELQSFLSSLSPS